MNSLQQTALNKLYFNHKGQIGGGWIYPKEFSIKQTTFSALSRKGLAVERLSKMSGDLQYKISKKGIGLVESEK